MGWIDSLTTGLSNAGDWLGSGLGFDMGNGAYTQGGTFWDAKGLSGDVFGDTFDGGGNYKSILGDLPSTALNVGYSLKKGSSGLGGGLDAMIKYGLPAYGQKYMADKNEDIAKDSLMAAAMSEKKAEDRTKLADKRHITRRTPFTLGYQ